MIKKFYILLLFGLFVSCTKDNPTTIQGKLKDKDFQRLIELSDTSTLVDINDFSSRIAEIQDIFSMIADRRGVYPTILKAITNYYISSLDIENGYKYPEQFNAFYLDFCKRFLSALHIHLLGQKNEYHWEQYFKYAQINHKVSRLTMEGINSHFTIDMARAVASAKLSKSNQADWNFFGTQTLDAVSSFTDELYAEYGVDATDVFRLFFLGDVIDGLAGAGSATKFGYEFLRTEAFNNGVKLQIALDKAKVEESMKISYTKKDQAFILLERMELLP